jgi:hypothetical protein
MGLPDGHSLFLQTAASCAQFFGYAHSGDLKHFATNSKGEKVKLPATLPAIQVQRANADKKLFDGQTLALFLKPELMPLGVPDEKYPQRIADFIQKTEKKNGNKILIALVTVTLIDAAGNPIHRKSLTAEQATAIARQLANGQASKLYGIQPFRDGPSAQFKDGQWRWEKHQGYGLADIQASVRLAANGSTNNTDLQLFYSPNDFQPSRRAGTGGIP